MENPMKKWIVVCAMALSGISAFASEMATESTDSNQLFSAEPLADALAQTDAVYPREVICFAQNRRGMTFRAVGFYPPAVQRRALDACYSYSWACRALGCRPY